MPIVAAVLLVAGSFAFRDRNPWLSNGLAFSAIVCVVLWVLLAVVTP